MFLGLCLTLLFDSESDRCKIFSLKFVHIRYVFLCIWSGSSLMLKVSTSPHNWSAEIVSVWLAWFICPVTCSSCILSPIMAFMGQGSLCLSHINSCIVAAWYLLFKEVCNTWHRTTVSERKRMSYALVCLRLCEEMF